MICQNLSFTNMLTIRLCNEKLCKIFKQKLNFYEHSQNWDIRLLPSSYLSFSLSVCLSVCLSAKNNSASTILIFVKLYNGICLENL